ncbi:MAG: hypothetical protein JNL18_01375 [Planctomycetaceae bacterium]|jgi:hypothetical protein|uniref:Uncharacterized protein n=1 Tax=Lacipirellula limnantheis TaxID=2528024 RepID=A0A517U365_9BACT|nr:hypothetical protein [Lacipirellula limnantheis]MBL9161369.1 hypothetical protein [Planctomycetaceae bacterium]QDT75053.1 hypothetical protein I41_42620 [Lacipirellula limnantheis]
MGLQLLASGQCSRTASLAIALSAAVALVGCQSFAPAGIGALAAKQREQKIVKQAANDPFPSPKDVGLGGNDNAKSL